LTRLLDMVGANPLLPNAIRLIMAQRLVRRLDDATKQPYQPDDAMKNHIQGIIDTFPSSVSKPDISSLTLYKPGSSAEKPFGFDGQIALREQLVMSSGIQQLLRLPPAQITSDDLQAKAIEDGMRTMLHDGVLKAISGQTTIEEVFRVVS
jgi:type IV pilus assembly protein PilB